MIRERIQRLERNYCVTAGAGAGKTQCMVDTYAGLLAGQAGNALVPEQIVAITFTEKAADEMRTRVAATLAERARRGDAGADWSQLRLALEWAPIDTIHGFCVSLLKEFAVLLGLDPDFGVLDAPEYELLLQEVTDNILRQDLARRDPTLAELLTRFDLGRLAGTLVELHQQLAGAGVDIDQAIQATDRAHQDAQRQAPTIINQFGQSVLALAEAYRAGLVNPRAKYAQNLAVLLENWPRFQDELRPDLLDYHTLARLKELLGGSWGKINDLRKVAVALVDQLQLLASLPRGREVTLEVMNLLRRVDRALERELAAQAVLSFDHLLLLARRLLREHPPVLARLRRRWRVIMVDEFQDVNPVQGQMVRLLAGLEDPAEYRPPQDEDPPRLLVVGDPKQSIYAFRGAEVAEFTRTMQNFSGGEVVSLPENFRSAPELVEFFNQVFPDIFAQGEKREYAPEAYLEFGEADRQEPRSQSTALEGRAVEVVLVGGEGSLALRRQEEARALAWYLERLIREQGAQPGEIVVLLRKLTQVAVYEEALRRAGVDFYTVRGRGFFDCQEVADMLMALQAVVDPEDEVALAGFLRSPLVGLSDQALLALVWEGAGDEPRCLARSLEIELPGWIPEQEHQRWHSARQILSRLRPLARRMLPAELLERLMEDTGIIPVLSACPGGGQKVANLRKLLEMARDPQGVLQGGVLDFTQGLASLVDNPPQDAQAPLVGERSPVVRLMSVHQAKGLQFEVVILADPAGRPGGGWGSAPPPGPGGVVGLKPRDPAWGDLMDTLIYRSLRDRQVAREEAEEARLFYVACTRARRRLAFMLYEDKRHQTRWAEWVRDMVESGEQQLHLVKPGQEDMAQGQPPSIPARNWPSGLPPDPGPQHREGARVVARCLERAAVPVALVRESVSGLESWFECPRLWFHTRRLGLDTGALWERGEEAGQGAGLSPVELGHAVHMLLELAPLEQGPGGLEEVSGLVGRRLGLEPGQIRAAAKMAAGLWQTGLGGRLAGLPKENILREQEFVLHLPAGEGGPEVEVMGSLDLVLVEESGPLVVDYKVTGHIQPQDYRDQLALYALALWSGGSEGAVPPRTALCYLWSGGGRLVELEFSPSQLQDYRRLVQQAAAEMARLGPEARLEDVPAREDCTGCLLAGRGICGR